MHYKVASKRERERDEHREYAWKRIRLVESTRNGGEKERAPPSRKFLSEGWNSVPRRGNTILVFSRRAGYDNNNREEEEERNRWQMRVNLKKEKRNDRIGNAQDGINSLLKVSNREQTRPAMTRKREEIVTGQSWNGGIWKGKRFRRGLEQRERG